MNIYYRIHTDKFGTLYAEWVESDPSSINNRTRGDSATFDLHVPQDDKVVQSGTSETIPAGAFVVTQDLLVESNATLTVNGTLIVHGTSNVEQGGTIDGTGTVDVLSGPADPQATLLEYDRHAGSYSLTSTLNNTQRYKERLPSSPNINSLVVGLEPATDMVNEEIIGKWGLISNVTDNRTRALTNPIVTVDIEILADYPEYSDVTSIQNDLAI